MRAVLFNWLLIGLMVVSFAGRPWAQVLPATTQGCGGQTAAIEHTYTAATHETGTIETGKTTAPQHDSGKAKSADCVKSCAAVQVLAISAVPSWAAETWPQIHSAAVEATLHGQTPKPELSPPIARV
jgi:hypothetical protein